MLGELLLPTAAHLVLRLRPLTTLPIPLCSVTSAGMQGMQECSMHVHMYNKKGGWVGRCTLVRDRACEGQ